MKPTLAEVLRQGRLKKGLSQRDAAKMLEIDQATLSRIEHGLRYPGGEAVLQKMVRLYDLEWEMVLELFVFEKPRVTMIENPEQRNLLEAWVNRDLAKIRRMIAKHFPEPV